MLPDDSSTTLSVRWSADCLSRRLLVANWKLIHSNENGDVLMFSERFCLPGRCCNNQGDSGRCELPLVSANSPSTPQELFDSCRSLIKSGDFEALGKVLSHAGNSRWIRSGGLDLEHASSAQTSPARTSTTLLHLACEKGNANCANELLQAKASPNVQLHHFGASGAVSRETPLHLAVANGSEQCVQVLLDAKVLVMKIIKILFFPSLLFHLQRF